MGGGWGGSQNQGGMEPGGGMWGSFMKALIQQSNGGMPGGMPRATPMGPFAKLFGGRMGGGLKPAVMPQIPNQQYQPLGDPGMGYMT